jgi:hypothetical protein
MRIGRIGCSSLSRVFNHSRRSRYVVLGVFEFVACIRIMLGIGIRFLVVRGLRRGMVGV